MLIFTGNMSRQHTEYGNRDSGGRGGGNNVEVARGAFTNTGQQIPRHIYAFY